MSTIVTRAGKGSPLTHTEVDNNFTNLNTDKLQSGSTASSLVITSADINGGNIDGTAIGSSTASTGAFTTATASTSFGSPVFKATNSAGGALQNSSGTNQLQWGGGGGNNLSVDVAININPANAQVAISPTGTGSVTINPATAGTINNMSIGATTASTGAFTSLTSSSTTTLNGTTIPSSKTLVVTTDIGSTVQAYDAQLADVAGLTPTDNSVIIGNGTNFVVESGSTLRTSLGLAIGTDVQAYSSELQGASQGGINGFKNRIINGAMTIWQRGTTLSTNNSQGYYIDRMWGFSSSTACTFTQGSSSGVAGLPFFSRAQRTAGQAAGGGYFMGQIIESNNLQDLQGQSVTVSFWARAGANYSATSNILVVFLRTGTTADQGLNQLISGWTGQADQTSNVTLTTSWQYFSKTFTVASSVQEISPFFQCASTGTAGADDYFDITGFQLEKGSTATSFDYRPYGTELVLCQRYYETIGLDGIGGLLIAGCATAASQQVNNSLVYKVTKRATPTVTKVGTWNLVNAAGQPTVFGAGNDSVLLFISSSAAGQVYAQNGSGAYVTISIEI